MGDQAEYKYDVFISYSHADRDWVWDELLPQLEAAGLKVIIDKHDFEPGAPVLTEMERAVIESRKTVLVLTPAYLKSEWTEFENILAQTLDPGARRRRVVPVMLRPCELPLRIRSLVYVDLSVSKPHDTQFQRLLTTLTADTPAQSDAKSSDAKLADSQLESENSAPTTSSPQPQKKGLHPAKKKITRILSARMWQGVAAIAGVLAIIAMFVVPEVRQFVGLEQPTLIANATSTITPTGTPSETPRLTFTSTATDTPTPTDESNSTDTPPPTSPPTLTQPIVTSPTTLSDSPYEMTIFADEDSLTVYVPSGVTSSLNDLNLEYLMNGQDERYFFAGSEGFVPYVDGTVPPSFCLHLERASNSAPFPLECYSVNKPIVRLPDGSVFWWDEFGQNTKTLFVNLGDDRRGVCAAGFSRCSVGIP